MDDEFRSKLRVVTLTQLAASPGKWDELIDFDYFEQFNKQQASSVSEESKEPANAAQPQRVNSQEFHESLEEDSELTTPEDGEHANAAVHAQVHANAAAAV